MIKMYGIRNCDTVKKARKWLDDHAIEFEFHDFKKHGLNSEQLAIWEHSVGWEALLNRRGTTWRKVPENVRNSIDAASAHQLMLDNPSIIKRPVVDHQGSVTLGFNADEWTEKFVRAQS